MEFQNEGKYGLDLDGLSMTKEMATEYVASTRTDTQRLTSDVPLIAEALQLKIVQEWFPVRSVISILTNKDEVDGIVQTVPPESTFYHNPARVRRVAGCLSYWRERNFFNNHDAFANAFNVLTGELTENVLFLDAHQG